MSDAVNRPSHYNSGKFEAIDVIEDWKLGFNLGNTVKYISRAGKKDATKTVEDLKKARWYLDREISRMEPKNESVTIQVTSGYDPGNFVGPGINKPMIPNYKFTNDTDYGG